MKLNQIIGLALVASPALAVPPEDFGFPSAPNDTIVDVAFPQANGSYVRLLPGDLFGINVPASQPTFALNASRYASIRNYTGRYLALMVDPDASTPQMPTNRFILHYFQPNITAANASNPSPGLQSILPSSGGSLELMNNSAPIAAYMRPRPPTNSSAHRYIIYVFKQPENFTIPEEYRKFNNTYRQKFNLTGFVSEARLGTPAAANYFYATNESSVPADFFAAAGGSYPGGNGGLVASGDPGKTAAPSPTGSTGSPSSSTTPNAAAMVTGMSGLLGAGLVGLAALL